jgi:vitamin B12/bleomycin/antimicrobial peptide transport system ATP-binding/permease protein
MTFFLPLWKRLQAFAELRRKVWALSKPYFLSEEKWQARGLLLAIVLLNLGAVWMLVLINDWNRLFYDALQDRNAEVFWVQLRRFLMLAFGFIIIAVYKQYLTQVLAMKWRAWMSRHYLERWLASDAFYKMELARFTPAKQTNSPDNPDQRIQEDIHQFTSSTLSLSMGLLNAVVTLVSFIGILWGLSGGFSFEFHGQTYEIAGFMVWMALIYCLLGSVATHYIGRPLIRLNFEQQRYEADFRHHMVRVREYSEAIALDRGEKVERQQLDVRLGNVLANTLKLLMAQKRLSWFTVGFSQAATVFPFVVAAPRFFSGAIQLGDLMQIATAFGRVQDALSWFVDSYDELAVWRATTDRLTGFEAGVLAASKANPDFFLTHADSLQSSDLSLGLPSGEALLNPTSLTVPAGSQVLIQGASGSGKSTLFRALAGIWPFAKGHLQIPKDAVFIPQRPYFPNGPLREALAYPEPPERYRDEAMQAALVHAMLPELAAQLDHAQAWGQILSGGEQQRLALARVILKQPAWVFADEATSALDEATQSVLYARLKAMVQLRQGSLLSITHRPTLAEFHEKHWTLLRSGEQNQGPLTLRVA